MRAIAKCDEHSINGKYSIRSLCFDNIRDTALREKIDGVNCIEKFSIRYYNSDTSVIRLEKKRKINGCCKKETVNISLDEASKLIDGNIEWMLVRDEPILIDFYSKMKSQVLRPKTIIDYDGEAFIYPAGNVRVTID